MTTLREAAQQALEQVQEFKRRWWLVHALRAALAKEPADPPGCDYCNHPLYAATKCRVCGRVTEPKEQAEEFCDANCTWADHAPGCVRAEEQAAPVCKCDLRTRLVGDGCEVCNPELAAELAQEQTEPMQEQR